ncbi:acyltransferase [Paraburkholderia agricolaris]|uniref:Acyltransferase n=1 Tax=Paraburkholderia agricolaris TaxID=2152888 RepID=A0ABW8ZV70_9BURK
MEGEVSHSVPTTIVHAKRIKFLDGLRGVSILFVLIQHAFGPWSLMFHNPDFRSPFSDGVTYFPPILFSYLAVQLFFFVSGYVILITLDKCSGFWEFIYRRWIRLFPAMLICSLLVYFTASIFHERPMGQPHLSSLLPGLTFIEPTWWTNILGRPQPILEGAFWSLYVEVRFYFLFGIIYFLLGARKAIAALIALFMIGIYIRFLHSVPALEANQIWHFFAAKVDVAYAALQVFGLGDSTNYGMFACGAVFAKYLSSRNPRLLVLATALGLSSGLMFGCNPEIGHRAGGIMMGVLFMCIIPISCAIPFMQRFFASKFFVFMGFVSYPLYLFHQNMMVASIVKLRNHFPDIPPVIATVLSMMFVIALSWIIAKYCEPVVKNALTRLTHHKEAVST